MFVCEYCNKLYSTKSNLKRHGDCRDVIKPNIATGTTQKRKLIEDTNAVRKKYKTLKLQSPKNRLGIEEFYKPVTIQPKSLFDVVKSVSKHKPKKVDVDTATSKESCTLKSNETNKEEEEYYNKDDDDVYDDNDEDNDQDEDQNNDVYDDDDDDDDDQDEDQDEDQDDEVYADNDDGDNDQDDDDDDDDDDDEDNDQDDDNGPDEDNDPDDDEKTYIYLNKPKELVKRLKILWALKQAVPRKNSSVTGAVTGVDEGAIIASPIRKERLKKSKKELAAEAAEVLRRADKVECIADNKGIPKKYSTLPNRKKSKENIKEYTSSSLDRCSNKRRGSQELVPPKKPPRTFASVSNLNSSSKPSVFDIFRKTEKKAEPKKSNLRRSVSDASALKSRAYGPLDSNTKIRKRAGSDSEDGSRKTVAKKQLTPIIEVSQREDYFAPIDKENINSNIPEASVATKDKRLESVTDQLRDYIQEVDEALYKETGIRITTPPAKKDPTPIIIDVDKAENISSNKKHKLNFGLGKKLKSLTQKKPKINETEHQKNNNVNVLVTSTPKNGHNKPDSNIKSRAVINKEVSAPNTLAPNIQSAIEELKTSKKSTNRSPVMIHSSQKPADKPPLTKGKTVNTMVKRLSHDSCSSPPPTRTNVLIMPNMSVQHNNNQPFSYTRGISPDKYRSNEDLPRDLPNSTKPVIYAQVVCGANGLNTGKQTVHTQYNARRQPQSDSDEGLGGEDSLGYHKKYEREKSFTHFGDDRMENFLSDTDKLLDEIDKYKAESPILPKYRSPTRLNGFSSYDGGVMERGRGDGMDSKRRESLTEPENEFLLNGNSPRTNFSLNRTDLSTRRDMLESRINRRIIDKTTPSPEYTATKNNVYVSEKSSKYYKHGSPSPVGYKEKYVSETKKDQFGERHTESRTKKVFGAPEERLNSPSFRYNGFDAEPKSLDSQISDYRSSPENHRFESSHHTNSRSRYRAEKPKLIKDKTLYKSTPEIHQISYPYPADRHNPYHNSLPREDKFQSTTSSSQLTRSERTLNRDERDRRTDKFVDSGIENDFRRDSSERYKPTRPARTRRDLYNESEDEGFASSLLITSEKQHTENNLARKPRREYDSDRNPAREDDIFRHNDSKFIPRERSIDDGSHFDPRLDKDVDRSTLKRIEKKPPKPEKKSGLDKVKSLFMRDSKKKKEKNRLQTTKSKSTYSKQEERDELSDSKIGSSLEYRYRRRLSTPSPTRDAPKSTKSESTHGSWFKSLDRITRRNNNKRHNEDTLTSTEEEPITNPSKLSSSTSNLRFFGDTDQESNGDSIRGTKPSRKRPGLRSQSTRDLHNISEELQKNSTTSRKMNAHHKSLTNISESNRELKGSRSNLKPPISPNPRYRQDPVQRDDRRRRKKHDLSSVESSTEGDSSQQSQRSIVYLHAATVGDIPGPEYLRTARRSASREDLTSNGSSFIQPQVKTLSRSFSVLAPWRPRHPRDALNIDYTQNPKPTTKNGKYDQKSSRNISSRNENSTLKRKTQDSKKNSYQQTLNRKSKSKENLTKQPREEITRGSTSTLYKKKDKSPRENSRYNKDREDRRIPTKSHSVESISRSRDENRDVSRSVSMPRDSAKSAGWFRKTKKVTSSQRL